MTGAEWQPSTKNPAKTDEYLAALLVGPEQYAYTVEKYHVVHGWEMEAFLGAGPDFWQEILPPSQSSDTTRSKR
jgi:hypothetical protein